MKAALEAQAKEKFLVTNIKDYQSAGFISRASAEAYSIGYEEEISATLRSGLIPDVIQAEVYVKGTRPHNADEPQKWHQSDTANTLNTFDIGETRCNEFVVEPTYCIQGNTIDRSDTAGANGKGVIEDKSYTLNTVDRHAVCHSIEFCPNNSSTAAGLSEEDEKTPTLSVTKNIAVCYTIGNGQADQTKLHDVAGTLNCMHDQQSVITAYPINTQVVTRSNKLGEGTGFGIGEEGSPSYTLQEAYSHGVIYAIDRAAFNQGENAKYDFQIEDDGVTSTIVARGPSAVCYNSSLEGIANTLDASYYKGCGVRGCREREFVVTPNDMQNPAVWIVRRLTPRECERLQGFEDDWTLYDTKANELKDTPRYKALGNSIAIPCALRVFKGIVEMENKFN